MCVYLFYKRNEGIDIMGKFIFFLLYLRIILLVVSYVVVEIRICDLIGNRF